MPTIDLSTTAPGPTGLLDGLLRRVTLTLPELQLVADRAGGAPLPFELAAPRPVHALEDRLGDSRSTTADRAYASALAGLHDPHESLSRRGLLGEADEESALTGAIGLLGSPETALDLDVTAAGLHARSWQRRAGGAVATLSTGDGIVFELAWFAAERWPEELARAAVLPADCELAASGVPPVLDLPFELADAASEAVRTRREDLLPVLIDQAAGPVLDGEDRPLAASDAARALTALNREARGRLRVLLARVEDAAPDVVGVVSWTLLADGWRALRPHQVDGHQRVRVGAVLPGDLAAELAPVLAEVVS